MIIRASERKEKKEVLSLMEPLIAQWFDEKFDYLTEPQGFAIPLIHQRENVLVSSPTGSGKTLTAFLSIINELFKLDKKGALEERIYCVYVSPLKALANDIHKNLERPLEEIRSLAEKRGMKISEINTAIRSGDTSQAARRKMVNKPPHILITTPESLALVLSSPKFRKSFDGVQYFIMDEIHDICSSKRGSFLSLNVERLEELVKGRMTRIGLSATQAPITEIAEFLGGDEDEEPRDVNIIEVMTEKHMDLSVISPVDDMTVLPYEVVNARMYDLLKKEVEKHRTTLIFTNTRSGAESVAFKLKEREIEDIAAHHGSLSKETRITVEDDLKDGELDAAVSSTSLELGIDVGFIDLVMQVGSPKSVAKGLQRVGRAGHGVGETSKGRMIVFEKDDLVECTVLTRQAYLHEIDRVNIPKNNLDVLAQTLVGMSIEKRWDVEEAYRLVKRSYCFKELERDDFNGVLNYLSGSALKNVYSKVWYNKEEGVFGKKGGIQMIYYLNIGTIPSDSSFRVYSDKGVPLGKLSEKFVERLTTGDVFILGGKSYEFIHTKGTKVFVGDAVGKKPTVPSWTGEMLPRSFDLSMAIGEFRRNLYTRLRDQDPEVISWLMKEYRIDQGSARTIVSYFKEQMGFGEVLPTDQRIVVEGYVDEKQRYNIIFHACFGRRVNDALSRAYAYAISRKYNCSTRVAITDDCFMVTTKKKVSLEGLKDLVREDNIGNILKRGIRNTELFKQRFRHCAGRAFMVLRNYKGKDISVAKQKRRAETILDTLHGYDDFPITKETYNEILYQVLDLKHAREVLRAVENNSMDMVVSSYADTPSPFAHNVVMIGISDVVMMDDRSSLLRQFHQKVLEKVIPKEEIESFQFKREIVDDHFFEKRPSFGNKEGLLDVIRELGPVHVFNERGKNVYLYTERTHQEVRRWAKELLRDEEIQSVWMGDTHRWVSSDRIKDHLLCLNQGEPPSGSAPLIDVLKEDYISSRELYHETDMKLGDISNMIRDMERRRLVNRRDMDGEGKFRYGLLPMLDIDMEKVEEYILDYLEYDAPREIEEIAFALAMPEDRVMNALNNLVESGRLVSGKLVIGEGMQYMLYEDYHDLKFPGKEHVSEDKILLYRAEKMFDKFDTIREYFEFFVEASSPYEVHMRVRNFQIESWEEMRNNAEILEGRFLRGKVRYVLKDDLPMLVGAYRTEELDQEEQGILKVIESGQGNTIRELKKISELPAYRVKEIIKKLDSNLYVMREFTGDEGWSSKNVYKSINIRFLPREEARRKLVERLLKAHGPTSISDLRYMTGFFRREVETVLSSMVRNHEAMRVRVGPSKRELYLMSYELEPLKKAGPSELKRLRILSKNDQYAGPLWAEIYARYGDDWIYPIIKRGKVIGGLEIWEMSGCIEFRHIDLEDPSLLGELLDEVDEMMKYYKLQGFDVLRVRYFNNIASKELGDGYREVFLQKGYVEIQGMLVKGNVVSKVFEEKELLAYLMYKQHLAGNPLDGAGETVKELRGARSDGEITERIPGRSNLQWMHRRGEVVQGKMIPPYLLYCYMEDASVYRAAKSIDMDHVMEEVLHIVESEGPLSKRLVTIRSPYSEGRTKKSLDTIYNGSVVCKNYDGMYAAVPDNGMDQIQALKKVVLWCLQSFGYFTAEDLSSYIGSSIRMAVIREALADLVEEGYLVKGFFKKDDESIHWMIAEGLDKVGNVKVGGEFVIGPKDRLNLYLRDRIKERFDLSSCYVVFHGVEMVAAFKGKTSSGILSIQDFQGDKKYLKAVKRWAYDHDLIYKEKKKKKRVSDYEVRKWYERTRGL
ncbi:MAG: ATP-dependent helicase [Thermoplasmata archaeon]